MSENTSKYKKEGKTGNEVFSSGLYFAFDISHYIFSHCDLPFRNYPGIFWIEKFSKLVSSHFIIDFFFFGLWNILLLEVQSMEMNNNPTYCASAINYGKEKRNFKLVSHESRVERRSINASYG